MTESALERMKRLNDCKKGDHQWSDDYIIVASYYYDTFCINCRAVIRKFDKGEIIISFEDIENGYLKDKIDEYFFKREMDAQKALKDWEWEHQR